MKHPLYSEAEKATITCLYPTHSPAHVAQAIGRSVAGVKQFAARHGIKGSRSHVTPGPPPPTPELLALLASVWTTQSRTATMKQLGLSKSTAGRYATQLGLGRAGSTAPKPVKPPKPARAPKPAKVAKAKPVKAAAPKPVKQAPKSKASKPFLMPPRGAAAPKPDYRIGTKIPCGKKRVSQLPSSDIRRPWQYPMNSPEYRAWMDSKVAGKVAVYGIDSMNRPTTRFTSEPR